MINMKKLMLYGGIKAEEYKEIAGNIKEENKKCLRMYSVLCSFVFLGLCAVSFVSKIGYVNRIIYLTAFVLTTLIHLALVVLKTDKIMLLEDLFIFILYGFGIGLSVNNPETPTLTFIILLVVVPIVFTDIPLRFISTILIAIIVYLIAAIPVMPMDVLGFNMYNICAFSFVSIALSSYLSRVKIERMLLMHRNKFLIECDQMTGLYNRASYDKDIQSVNPQEYFKLVSMDVNGLKRENDTYGHAAGDEMILSAAECLKKVIAPYGKCYRIGGDEFTAIIKTKTEHNFSKMLHDEAEKHICKTGTKLSISVGEADTGDSDSIPHIMHLADTRMYDEKKEYYRLSGDKR